MSKFRFRSVDGTDIPPKEWLPMWAALFPEADYKGYDELLMKHKSFSPTDFEEIGKWKDGAIGGRWRANVASVAYPIWMAAASKPPRCPEKNDVTKFLSDWSERKYRDEYANSSREKRFGLSRATTLLHFLRRVRTAMTRLLSTTVPNKLPWYLNSYCPLFLEAAALCGTTDLRAVDKALFSYGDRILPFEK
jgi:hypothetical protein